MVFQLDNDLWFPDPHQADDDGLLAVGGDLSVDRLLLAYSYGIFPWYSYRHREEPLWFCPMRRFVIFPNEIHVSHSMRQMMNQRRYEVTYNRDFEGVIKGCATAQNRHLKEGAWLGPQIISAYTELYKKGHAASFEVWEYSADGQLGRLVGGLYGVTLWRTFFGESMFSLVPNASKLALIVLARLLDYKGGRLIDCQFETPHLRSMGGRFISYDEFISILRHRT